jgi:hypothetical protein
VSSLYLGDKTEVGKGESIEPSLLSLIFPPSNFKEQMSPSFCLRAGPLTLCVHYS